MLRPWRFIAMTSMNSSWVIISVVPPVGLVQWMPKTLEGPLTDRVDPGQEERRSQLNAGLTDRRSRFSLIADRGFQGLQNAGFRDRAHRALHVHRIAKWAAVLHFEMPSAPAVEDLPDEIPHLRLPFHEELVGSGEIADRLRVGKSTVVHDWRYRYDDFPEPVVKLKTALVWA